MVLLQAVARFVVYLVRIPLRITDWIKVKLGYVSVPPLREFVYLDETSVVSLIASTTGGVTEQKSTVKRRQISGSITGGLGDKTSSLKGNIGATQERSSEAVSQYVIQSNFKELYEMRAEDFVIADEYQPRKSVPSKIWNKIVGDVREDIEETEFERGDLAEFNVKLGSHESYDFYTAMESVTEMFDTVPDESDLAEEVESQEIPQEELESFSNLIEYLLAGLVPIVSEVVEYGVVVEDDSATIVSKEYAERKGIDCDRLNLVGFVDSDKFWQEETRFLFDDDEYTVYCRLDNGTVFEEWMPIKLLSIVDSIIPGLGGSVREIPEMFEDAGTETLADNGTEVALRPRLKAYLEVLETESSLELDSDVAEESIGETLREVGETTERVEGVEEAIEALEDTFEEQGIDYELNDDVRSATIDDLLSDDFDFLTQRETDDWYLEVSFTAIYW